MQSTAALILAALAFTVTTGRKLLESEASLRQERTHPNSVYSMMDQHSTKEKSKAKSKYKGKEAVKIFYQTGVSNLYNLIVAPHVNKIFVGKWDFLGIKIKVKDCNGILGSLRNNIALVSEKIQGIPCVESKSENKIYFHFTQLPLMEWEMWLPLISYSLANIDCYDVAAV